MTPPPGPEPSSKPVVPNTPHSPGERLLANYDRDRRIAMYRTKRRRRLVLAALTSIAVIGLVAVIFISPTHKGSSSIPTTTPPSVVAASNATSPTAPPSSDACSVVKAVDSFSVSYEDTISGIPGDPAGAQYFYTTYAEAQSVNATELASSLTALAQRFKDKAALIDEAETALIKVSRAYTSVSEIVASMPQTSPSAYQTALASADLTRAFADLGASWNKASLLFNQC